MLAEKAGDGDRQRTLGVIVDNGHRPCEFLPRGEEVEDAYRRDGRTGKRQYDAEEHREYAPAVGIRRLVKLPRDTLDVAFDHKRGKRNDPRDIERDQTREAVRDAEKRRELELRDDERRTRNDHHADDKREQQLLSRKLKACQTVRQRRGNDRRKDDRNEGHNDAVEKIQVKFLLRENVPVVFQRDLAELGEEVRRELVERAVRPERGGQHIDHRHDRHRAAQKQEDIPERQTPASFSAFHFLPSLSRSGASWRGIAEKPAPSA